jgi:hypothetical protein
MNVQSASYLHLDAPAATRLRARLLCLIAALFIVPLVIVKGALAGQDPVPPPPLPVDSRHINELLSDAERATVAGAQSNSKKLIEIYIKIAESHLGSVTSLTGSENGRAAVDELNIYNKAIAEAGKLTFGQQDGRRKLSKKLEQILYKHIKTLESIEREFPAERHPFAEDALKRAKQLRVQALNEAFAGGEILKDPEEANKKSTPPGKGGPPNDNELLELLAQHYRAAQYDSSLQLAAYHPPSLPRALAQIPGDYLTEEEDEHVREAQESDKRARVFMKIADRRLAAITGSAAPPASDKKAQKKAEEEEREWGALPKLSRADLLRHYARTVEECMVKLEDAYERNPKSSAIPKALSLLRDATDKHLEILRGLTSQVKGDSEDAALREAIEQAEAANKGARDGLK